MKYIEFGLRALDIASDFVSIIWFAWFVYDYFKHHLTS